MPSAFLSGFCALLVLCTFTASPAQTPSTTFVLPTDNDALLRNDGPGFYMFVDRNFEKQQSTPWEGGQFGYVRGPVRVGSNVVQMHFHEGVDIAPVKRDATGEPLDEVRSISQGVVVHVSANAGGSNYGRYVVIQHDCPDGSFFSLYAHLNIIKVPLGQKVEPGSVIGIMGHTGAGIDRRRSHVHVELNLILNTRFDAWHTKNFKPSPNNHGIYNGLNLTGINIAEFLIANHQNPSLRISDFIKGTEATWKVTVPRNKPLELLEHYPWLSGGEGAEKPSPSWEITLSDSGLPLQIKPSSQAVTKPQVTWVKDRGIPHSYYTRGYVSGSGVNGALTSSGFRFMELLTGDF